MLRFASNGWYATVKSMNSNGHKISTYYDVQAPFYQTVTTADKPFVTSSWTTLPLVGGRLHAHGHTSRPWDSRYVRAWQPWTCVHVAHTHHTPTMLHKRPQSMFPSLQCQYRHCEIVYLRHKVLSSLQESRTRHHPMSASLALRQMSRDDTVPGLRNMAIYTGTHNTARQTYLDVHWTGQWLSASPSLSTLHTQGDAPPSPWSHDKPSTNSALISTEPQPNLNWQTFAPSRVDLVN